jgi:diguanylate cyclase (GGDEF)-like protein
VSYDVDHFKHINDTFGHLAGDQLLIESCRLVKSSIRENDLFGRLGGDEFLIVCPETDLSSTVLLAQRLCQMIGKWSYVYQSRRLDFSISVGVATVTDDIRRPEELLQRADEHLYRSKRRGRKQVSY